MIFSFYFVEAEREYICSSKNRFPDENEVLEKMEWREENELTGGGYEEGVLETTPPRSARGR